MDEREYETSPQTAEALSGIVKAFAGERGVTDKFVYAILSGKKRDIYHIFKHDLFRPALRASVDSARVFAEDLQSEIERSERVQFSKGIDHAIVIQSILSVLTEDAKGSPKSERVQAMRKAHRMMGLYLRSIEFEDEGGEVISMDRPTASAKR
jgi:hypothetical protein